MAKEKFVAHRVLERVSYGVGARLKLSAPQIADRRHALDVEDEKTGIVTVTDLIEFRAGEDIAIAHELSRHEEGALQAVVSAKREKPNAGAPAPEINAAPLSTDEGDSDDDAGEDAEDDEGEGDDAGGE